METACADLERELADVEAEATTLLAELRDDVDALSDLRYGTFAARGGGAGVRDEASDGMRTLRETCGRVLEGGQKG